MLPIVGLGGSAGSIPALQRFFAAMPADSGMAFVVVLHLAADHASIMDEILARSTAMPVVAAKDEQKVEANTVYVDSAGEVSHGGPGAAAPGAHGAGSREAGGGRSLLPLAGGSHGPDAAAIVLSGADGDGALGIKRIKERGGLTIAQDAGGGRAPEHAALGDRHRDGRLGSAGGGDAGATDGVPGQRGAAATSPRGGRTPQQPPTGRGCGRERAARGAGASALADGARLCLLQAGDGACGGSRGGCR